MFYDIVKCMKRLMNIFLSLVLILTFMHIEPVHADSMNKSADLIEPEFISISADKKDVSVGDSVKFRVEAKDNQSGIDLVRLTFVSPVRNNYITIDLDHVSGNIYETDFKVFESRENGLYEMYMLEISDEHNNRTYIREDDLKHCNFNVTGSHADLIEPVFVSLQSNKVDASIGETITFAVTATDDQSGIDLVRLTFVSPIRNDYISIDFDKVNDTTYVSEFKVFESRENGLYEMYMLEISDEQDNRIYIRETDLKHCNFNVYGSDADLTSPEFLDMRTDKKSVKVGDSIKFSVDTKDEQSGIDLVRLTFVSPIRNNYITIDLDYVSGNTYETDFKVYESREEGLYEMYMLEISDEHDNRTYIREDDLKHCNFYVGEGYNPFVDVQNKDIWYYSYVLEANELGLMTGLDSTHFGTDEYTTRAMIATVLYRMAGKPSVTGTSSFNDVQNTGMWYYTPVLWAAKNGVITGYQDGSGNFGPEDNVTREQLALMLMRYAKVLGYDTSSDVNLSTYPDGASVSPWAADGMKWAIKNGIMKGGDDGCLKPGNQATRAECAKMLVNFYHMIND